MPGINTCNIEKNVILEKDVLDTVPTLKKTIGASDTMFERRPIKLDEIRPKNNLSSNFGKHAIR